MTRHLTPIDISTSADLIRVAEEVAASGSSRLLMRGEHPLAVVQPLPERPSRRRRRSAEPADDPLLGLIGMLDAGEPTEIARFKDQYLAEAVDRRGRCVAPALTRASSSTPRPTSRRPVAGTVTTRG